MPPSVAIIMRAKDEMPYVQQALTRLEQQTVSTFDLFAVDSGSTDGTFQTLEKSGCHLTRIKPEDYVPGTVLNDAVKRTHHEILVLLNADAIPQSDTWLEQLLFPIIGKKADATFCKQVARPDAKFIVNYDYERGYRRESMSPDFFSAVACAFTRELWDTLPFPENGYAEDARWAAEIINQGFTIEYVEACAVEHSHNYSFSGLFQKRYRQAQAQGELPNPGKQTYSCIREVIRDLAFALSRCRLLTIPYNIVYRVTIHRAIHAGRKKNG